HALAHARLHVRALGLSLGHVQERDLLALLQTRDHLEVVEVADAGADDAHLETLRAVDEHDLSAHAAAARARCPGRRGVRRPRAAAACRAATAHPAAAAGSATAAVATE